MATERAVKVPDIGEFDAVEVIEVLYRCHAKPVTDFIQRLDTATLADWHEEIFKLMFFDAVPVATFEQIEVDTLGWVQQFPVDLLKI